MTLSTARDRTVPHVRLHAISAALALSLLACAEAQALGFGRAQVHSAQGSALNVTLPITELTQEDQRSLSVRLAPESAWSQAGLKPPAPLADMRVQLEAPAAGAPFAATRRIARITSAGPTDGGAIDLLFVISTASGERQVQFSVLAPPPGLARPGAPIPASVASNSRATARSSTSTADATPGASTATPAPTAISTRPRGNVVVRLNDNLSEISEKYPVTGATYYQMVVALWQANPGVFIENNMNLVREGERLSIPSADAVRAVDPALAQRLYNEQLDAHAKYRARMGGMAARSSAVVGGPTDQGRVQSTSDAVAPSAPAQQDRLRLSGADGVGGGSGAPGSAGAGAGTGAGAGANSGAGAGAGVGSGAGGGSGTGGAGGASSSGTGGRTGAGMAGVAGLTAGATDDQRTSNNLAFKEVADRVNQLQRNVDDLKAAGAAAGTRGATSGSAALGTTGSAAGANAGSGATSGAAGSAGRSTAGSATGGANGSGSAGNGAAGTSGTSGAAGTAGTSGAAGTSGTAGTLGAAGTAGTAGASGAAGTSGTSGAAGTTRVGPLGGTLPPESGATSANGGGTGTSAQGAASGAGAGAGSTGSSAASGNAGSGSNAAGAGAPGTGSGATNAAGGTSAGNNGAGSNPGGTGATGTNPNNANPTGATPTGADPATVPGTSTDTTAGNTASGAAAGSATSPNAAPGAPGAASPNPSSPAGTDSASDNNGSLMSASGLPAWLTDNLLIVLTAVLAFIAFIIAWVVRRAAGRREDQSDSDLSDDEPSDRTIDPDLIDKRLDGIDLDLNNPPTDEPRAEGTADSIPADDRRSHLDAPTDRRT